MHYLYTMTKEHKALVKQRRIERELRKLDEQEIKIRKQVIKELKVKPKIRRKFDKGIPQKYKSYVIRADDKGFPLEFTLEEFLEFISKPCTYCGIEPANGIDRIDSTIGYTKSNSVPCCKYCNSMKYTYSTEFFLEHISKIHNFNKEK